MALSSGKFAEITRSICDKDTKRRTTELISFEPVHEISKKSGILTCEDSDEHLQPPIKLRQSKWCSVSILANLEYSSDQQRL